MSPQPADLTTGGYTAVVFDLDDTLCDTRHRSGLAPYNDRASTWEAYSLACGDDPPLPAAVTLAWALSTTHLIVYVSGRSDVATDLTRAWIESHLPPGRLYLRPAGDHRPNEVYKAAMLDRVRTYASVVLWVDDHPAVAGALDVPVLVVRSWRDDQNTPA